MRHIHCDQSLALVLIVGSARPTPGLRGIC
jgi:hypothetical protein